MDPDSNQTEPDQVAPTRMSAERIAAIKWIAFVLVILGTSFSVAIVMLYVSATDPSFAVEPDYYNQALNWDEHVAQRTLNEELGWRLELSDKPSESIGHRDVSVALTDRDGAPIDGAMVCVIAFHNARAADHFTFEMEPTGNGEYSAQQPLQRAGRWEFRFRVNRGESVFTAIQPADLAPLPKVGRTP